VRVKFGEEAKITIYEVSDFIDSINTFGAGERWVTRLTEWVESYAHSNTTYALCNDSYLASLGLSCINFNDWTIAFKIESETFIVYKIIRGSLLA
jgi:hypothetical protein